MKIMWFRRLRIGGLSPTWYKHMPVYHFQRRASILSDPIQHFNSLCGIGGCGNHVIHKVFVQYSQTHLAANTHNQEAGPGVWVLWHHSLGAVFAGTLKQWNSLLARKDRASNHYISISSWAPLPPHPTPLLAYIAQQVHIRPSPSPLPPLGLLPTQTLGQGIPILPDPWLFLIFKFSK
jgi:hypothetical protein